MKANKLLIAILLIILACVACGKKIEQGKEKLYVYTGSADIRNRTGLIGHVRADFGSSGMEFWTTWWPFREDLNDDEFKKSLDSVINGLRETGFLQNRSAMAKWCYSNIDQEIDDRNWGFRLDDGKYTFLMRLNPNRGEYNLYCYCYIREWLDKHMKNAEKGIRFIDSQYKDLFRIPDGGAIKVTYPDGSIQTHTVRYINEEHMEIHENVYHICQYAEILERNGAKVEAV